MLLCWVDRRRLTRHCVPSPAAAIATGAAQYDLTPGYGWPNTIMEDYSSKGRTPIFFDAQGYRYPKAMVYLKPDVTGPDGLVGAKAAVPLQPCKLHICFRRCWCAGSTRDDTMC
jgi:hypothetical protein